MAISFERIVRLRLRLRLWLFLLALNLTGCGTGEENLLVKIDFSKSEYPAAVEKVTGLSGRTDAGRWSDANLAPSVKIKLREPLPPKVSILIRGMSLLNVGEGAVRIGAVSQKFKLENDFGYAEFFIDTAPGSDLIEIIPEKPTTPKELGINEDARRLGFLMSSISVYEDY